MTAAAFFLGGLIGLLVAGHFLVEGASGLGRRLGLSPTIVGLTIVAAGTSAPELAVVIEAATGGDGDLAMGSVIGSNIANILLVLGLAATFGAVRVSSRLVRIDIPVMIAVSGLFALLVLDGSLAREEGLFLVVGLVLFTGSTFLADRATSSTTPTVTSSDGIEPGSVTADSPSQSDSQPDSQPESEPVMRSLIEVLVGIPLLAGSARLVVLGAEDIAEAFGVPELIVGLTVVALGTSAPEIVTTIIAALGGQRDLAVGNAVGSNIYNILLVGGLGSVIAGTIPVPDDAIELDLPIMIAVAVACLPLMAWNQMLARWKGFLFLGYYVAYLVFLGLEATGHRAKDPFTLIMGAFVIPLTVVTVATVIVASQRRAARSEDQERARHPVGDRS